MDQNKYIEVRIFEPATEITTSNTAHEYSIKTLSTIHECDSSKISHSYAHNNIQKGVPYSTNLKSNIESFPSPKQKVDSLRNLDVPLDIDLLLRYYACNSNMEKSINEVLGKTDDQVSKDIDQGPLVELGAVYKICNSLEESSSKNSLLSTFRFHDVLTKLQSLIRRCNKETLEEILLNDPSMKMCKHCGVISCSRPRNISVESRRSLPKTSYFLSTQMFPDIASSGDDKSEMCRRIKRISPKREQATKRVKKSYDVQKNINCSTYRQHMDNEKACVSKEVSLTVKRENNFHINNPQQVETMVAERENDNETQETCSIRNVINGRVLRTDRTELQKHVRNSQVKPFFKGIAKGEVKSRLSEQMKVIPNFEDKDMAKSDITANFTSNVLYDRYFNQVDHKKEFIRNVPNNEQDEWKTLSKDQLSIGVSNEKVVKDILYEKPKSYLDDFTAQNCIPLNSRQSIQSVRSKQNRATNAVNDTTPSINVMAYLARGHLRTIDKGKKEFVSQLDERTCVHPRYANNKRSFVLHNSREFNPYPNSEFLIHRKLMPSKMARNRDKSTKILEKNSQNHLEYSKHIGPVKSVQQFSSFTCLVEDDSLENCIKASHTLEQPNESNTTVFSSSSAENMIREWVKAPQNNKESSIHEETCKSSYSSKPSIIGLNAEPQTFWTNKKCSYRTDASIDEQRILQANDTDKTWCPILSKNQTKFHFPSERTVSSKVNGSFKLWTSRESVNDKINAPSFKKIETNRSKNSFRKHLVESFKNIKSIKSMKFRNINTSTKPSMSSSDSLLGVCVKNIFRRIIYKESSLKNIIDSTGKYSEVDNILLLYRKVLENTEEMDWQSFQRFVENLHPNQKTVWREICRSIDNKLKKIADENDDSTEICIEITSVPFQGAKHERRTCNNEIVFEMDITLGDVERCLGRQLPSSEKEQLDILKRASEVTEVRNDDVCDTEAVSNQAE